MTTAPSAPSRRSRPPGGELPGIYQQAGTDPLFKPVLAQLPHLGTKGRQICCHRIVNAALMRDNTRFLLGWGVVEL